MYNRIARLWRQKEPKGQRGADLEKLLAKIDRNRMPRHIAIIMDGNGRWAKNHGLPRFFGHKAGVESLRDIVKTCSEFNIKILTVYAFSTENWKRPQEEVNVLMDLLVEYLYKEIDELCQKGVKVNPIGKLEDLPPDVIEALDMAVERSRLNKDLVLNLALNYGGRTEIVEAVRTIALKVNNGSVSIDQIDDNTISQYLYTSGQPDPDLLIRPSGDFRISNFLLWQLAYTEFWHTTVLWPDFRRIHLISAIVEYQSRERRFGGL
ncbi:MAG: isoprenyl transferase [Desulfotomaculaceae bacterium]|nr:isoprenyl transferase [Desulfotomaculaceae bacterium]MDD4766015.1 isoprenyl transferase [Desulfotomaculaceae bacterium]